MSYLMLARICKAVMTPFKLINTVMKGEKGEDFLIYARGILVFAVLIICCVTSSPDSLIQWLLIIFIGLVISGFVLVISDYAFFFLGSFISIATAVPAAIYDKCNVFIKYHSDESSCSSNTENASGGLGTGPKAQVGIRYFIERDKRMKVCHARYLGR